MEDSVLEHAALALRRRLVSPMRIEGTDRIGPRAFALIVDDGGRRSRLVFDLDPGHATLHFEPTPRSEEWRGGFGQRLRGAFLVDARLVAGDRRLEIDIAVRTIEPTYQLQAAWHGRGGNLWLVDLGATDPNGPESRGGSAGVEHRAAPLGMVAERLLETGPAPNEAWIPPAADPRPALEETPGAAGAQPPGEAASGVGRARIVPVVTEVLAGSPAHLWLRALPRRIAGLSRPALWQALTELLPGGTGEKFGSPEEFAVALLQRLTSARPPSSHAYRLPPATPLALVVPSFGPGSGSGAGASSAGRPVAIRQTASEWGLPEAWALIGELPAFGEFEVDLAEGPADPKEDAGRLFWILSRTHKALLRAESESRRSRAYAARVASEERRIARIGERLRQELSDEEGPLLRSWGEAILSHLHQVKRGDDVLVCPNLHEPDGPELRVPLDPARAATDVAESYFKSARRWDKGRAMRETRLGHVERALAGLRSLAGELGVETGTPEIVGARRDDTLPPHAEVEARFREATGPFYRGPQADPGAAFGRAGGPDPARIGGKPSEGGRSGRSENAGNESRGSGVTKTRRTGRDPGSRFRPRVYQTSDGWTVVVGRSNQENDYVTMKVAKQDDYWFHAHGVPGSHVVLKREGRKDNPSRKTIEEAAAIAAFYSKARNSTRAPVIYTLKKYVTKPRKAKAGLVTCTRETSIMVRPANPEPETPPEWED